MTAASPTSKSMSSSIPNMHPSLTSSNGSSGAMMVTAPSVMSPTYSKMHTSNDGQYRHRHHDHHYHHNNYYLSGHQNECQTPSAYRPKRVDTHDLKSKLANALGNNGKRYWASLLDFMTAKIDRMEFEEEAMMCLKSQHVHLHNSLVLGLLFNASADVPGPSSSKMNSIHRKRERDANGNMIESSTGEDESLQSDGDENDESINRLLAPPEKRLRLLAAGLSRKDRARVKNVPKAMTHTRNLASGATSSLGWAGAGADMLEKKRKEEEKKRLFDEKKKVKEVYTQIGSKDWKSDILSGSIQIASVQERLSLPIQQEIARALSAPLCVESKELPNLDSLRDSMTLQAVEAGLPRGAQPQAAALLMAALQNHLQNVTSSIITKIRANRQMGIRTTNVSRATSDEYQMSPTVGVSQEQGVEEQEAFDTSTRPSPPSRTLRTMASDLSSLSSSSNSLELHTGTTSSLADSSAVSLISTAPTSLPPASTSSSDEVPRSGMYATKTGEREEEDDEQDQVNSETSSDQRRENSIVGDTSSLQLRHLSFLLNLAPHTVVEPLGFGTQERLLASDWTAADEDALREDEWTSEGMLTRESRLVATTKMSSIPAGNTPSIQRSAYIIDQLAPVRLFDRKTLAEMQVAHNNGGNRNTKGGLTLPRSHSAIAAEEKARLIEGDEEEEENKPGNFVSTTFPTRNYTASGHHHHRGLDPHLYDVVDPVALLGSMVK